ncbi:MAG: hypothetical protein AB9903_01115 [Vulcanimicrobiota bacterium]
MDSIKPAQFTIDQGIVAINTAANGILQQNGDMENTIADIDRLQREHDSIDLTLKMPRKERIKANQQLYDVYYNKKYKEGGVKGIEMLLLGGCTAGFFAGAAAGGMNGLLFVGLCITGIFGETFVRSVMLSSSKIDSMMQKDFTERLNTVDKQLKRQQQHLQDIKSKTISDVIQKSVEAAKENAGAVPPSVDDEQDYIIIDGMKLRKKSNRALEYLASVKFSS